MNFSIDNFIAGQDSTAEHFHLNETQLERSVDAALAKSDYDYDGYITWDEYIYSMGDPDSEHHKTEYHTDEFDHKNNQI